jgi:hypothetical protein
MLGVVFLMNKEFFINKVSKINQTFEDEFKAEFNSPELIWDNLLSGAIFWQDIKNGKPEKDGQYLTYLQTGKYESIGFTQYTDGQFMSSFVTHWAFVGRP